MSSGISPIEPASLRISVLAAAHAEDGKRQQAHAASPATQPVFSAVMALANDRPADLQHARSDLEADIQKPSASTGLVYTILGQIDAQLRQEQSGQIDAAV